ncbi:MAG: tRNA (guanosine(46)-N7)-methyltransferase TrmB [Actinomycetia bacterium]|nr:tRNA (guanosine(46)-N7)-methyltransferase TrmB [Actinomycetes bacterium]
MADAPSQRVRTFRARRGRLSDAHHEALATLVGRWGLDAHGEPLDLAATFGRTGPVVVDIGCGMGESTRVQAAGAPGSDLIAVDVHTRGIATLLRQVQRDGATNVRVVLGDAVEFLEQRIDDEALAGARIYFPDPWPKARHRKRRLVQPVFVALLVDKLAPGAFIHCATDDMDYADQMLEVFGAEPRLQNPFDAFAPRPIPEAHDRPVTKYERRARRLGHPVRDVWVTRRLWV